MPDTLTAALPRGLFVDEDLPPLLGIPASIDPPSAAIVWNRPGGSTDGDLSPCFMCASEEWTTPPQVFASLSAEFGPFDLDAAATDENALCPRYYTSEEDGLRQPWDGRVWVNPPYGRGVGVWLEKAARSTRPDGPASVVVLLLPSRTDTEWFHRWIPQASEVRFVRGRLRFNGASVNAPFPSIIVIFRREATNA